MGADRATRNFQLLLAPAVDPTNFSFERAGRPIETHRGGSFMKLRHARTLVWILAIAASAVLSAGQGADAALLGIQVVVQLNSGAGFVTQGTALGGAAGAESGAGEPVRENRVFLNFWR